MREATTAKLFLDHSIATIIATLPASASASPAAAVVVMVVLVVPVALMSAPCTHTLLYSTLPRAQSQHTDADTGRVQYTLHCTALYGAMYDMMFVQAFKVSMGRVRRVRRVSTVSAVCTVQATIRVSF